MPEKKPGAESASERSKKNMPRTGAGKAGSGGRRSGRGSDRWVKKPAELTDRPACKKCGQVHTKCNGHTKHGPNKGKPCGANPPAGQLTCIKHGGNHPAQRRRGKERLLDMVDPAISQHLRILEKADTSDADRLKAIQMIYDRTGLRPGVDLNVGVELTTFQQAQVVAFGGEVVDGKAVWPEAMRASSGVDRSALDPPSERPALGVGGGESEDLDQAEYDLQSEIDRERYAEEDARIRSTGPVVRGEVVPPVVRPGSARPDRDPMDPPDYSR